MKHWFFNFLTLQHHNCLVEIFDELYDGQPIELTPNNPSAPGYPAAEPVYIQEENSNDLTEVFRSKTGYISLVETLPGQLNDLYARTNTQMRVIISVDDEIVFKGYVQAQQFSGDYMKVAATVKVPIMSYMAALKDVEIDYTEYDAGVTPFSEIFGSSFTMYDYIIMPNLSTEDEDGNDINPLELKVFNRAVCPYNTEFNYGIKSDGVRPSVVSPMTYGEFITAFCHLYGLIAHDVANTLLFTKYDHDGSYLKFDTNEIFNPEDAVETIVSSGGDSQNYADLFELSDNKNKKSICNPAKQVLIERKRLDTEAKLYLNMSEYVGYSSKVDAAVLSLQSIYLSSQYMKRTAGDIPLTGVRVVGDEEGEKIEVSNENEGTKIFECTFDTTYDHYNNLHIELDADYEPSMRITVRSGGKYYNFNEEGDPWINSPSYALLTSVDGKIDCYLTVQSPTTVVSFYPVMDMGHRWHFKFKEIKLNRTKKTNIIHKYTVNESDHRLLKKDDYSTDVIQFESPFEMLNTGYVPTLTYDYLNTSQKVLTVSGRQRSVIDEIGLYIKKINMFSENGVWRVVSVTRNIVDDNYTLKVINGNY